MEKTNLVKIVLSCCIILILASEVLTKQVRIRRKSYRLTKPEAHPYAVIVLRNSSRIRQMCSGSLVAPRWVLSSIRCMMSLKGIHFNPRTKLKIFAGTVSVKSLPPGSQVLESARSFRHPTNDLCLIKVKSAFNITTFVNIIRLSLHPWPSERVKNCHFTGFGRVDHQSLYPGLDRVRKTQRMKIRAPCMCEDKIRSLFPVNPHDLSSVNVEKALCSMPQEGRGTCKGDRGVGLVCGRRLVGVSVHSVFFKDLESCSIKSFSIRSTPCGTNTSMDVFVDVCAHIRWFNTHLRLYSPEQMKACIKRKPRNLLKSVEVLQDCSSAITCDIWILVSLCVVQILKNNLLPYIMSY